MPPLDDSYRAVSGAHTEPIMTLHAIIGWLLPGGVRSTHRTHHGSTCHHWMTHTGRYQEHTQSPSWLYMPPLDDSYRAVSGAHIEPIMTLHATIGWLLPGGVRSTHRAHHGSTCHHWMTPTGRCQEHTQSPSWLYMPPLDDSYRAVSGAHIEPIMALHATTGWLIPGAVRSTHRTHLPNFDVTEHHYCNQNHADIPHQ